MIEKQKRTSQKFSKWLKENGCELESKYWWHAYCVLDSGDEFTGPMSGFSIEERGIKQEDVEFQELYPAYDILNDICVKHADKFFGETGYYSGGKFTGIITMEEAYSRNKEFKEGLFFKSSKEIGEVIYNLIYEDKKQEAEDYIKKYCLFNPKNK